MNRDHFCGGATLPGDKGIEGQLGKKKGKGPDLGESGGAG